MSKVKKTNNILYRIEKNFPIKGVNFVDLTPTLINGESFKKVSTELKNKILEYNNDIDYIVSPDARGFLWGTYVAALLEKPLIPIRKHGKLPPGAVMATINDTTEYSNIELDIPIVDLQNKKCIFIDDVYATGGTYKACKKLVEMHGGIMENAYVILDIRLTNDNIISLITNNNLEIE